METFLSQNSHTQKSIKILNQNHHFLHITSLDVWASYYLIIWARYSVQQGGFLVQTQMLRWNCPKFILETFLSQLLLACGSHWRVETQIPFRFSKHFTYWAQPDEQMYLMKTIFNIVIWAWTFVMSNFGKCEHFETFL